MEYSKSGLALTERFEGCKLTAYPDVRGIWTIGYGHTGPDVVEGLTCTQEQADEWLREDTQTAVDAVNKYVSVQLTQEEFDALVDFVYNVGVNAFASSTLLRLLNTEQYSRAADQFDRWDYAGASVCAGLLRRREAETAEFDS